MATTDNTVPKQLTPFEPGKSGNPAGRPKGSKNRLSEEFVSALCEDFTANGAAVIARVREEKPDQYLRVVAGLVPKDLNIHNDSLDGLSDAELARMIAELRASLTQQGYEIDGDNIDLADDRLIDGVPIIPFVERGPH